MRFEEKMRTFDYEGRKVGVRLDIGTWAVIDWLAEQRGVKWGNLAREWVAMGTHGIDAETNVTKIIRSSAMWELSNETIFNDRADMHAAAGPVWRALGMIYSDDHMSQALDGAERLDGRDVDFGGFQLSAGLSEFGNVTFYIRNAVRDQPHIVISTPFSSAEWSDAMEQKFGDEVHHG